MEKELVSYEQAVALKELGIILDNNIGGFYAKLNSKMLSIDEKGRYYRISNATKRIVALDIWRHQGRGNPSL